MGGCYVPPCSYGMNDRLADRVCAEGVTVFAAALQAEINTAVTAGDTASAAQFTTLVTRALGIKPISINLVCVAFISDWTYGVASITFGVAAHATDP